MVFRSKDYCYTAYYHRLTDENGAVYCRALGAVTQKDEDFCRKCPLAAKYGRRYICFYFDLTYDEGLLPEEEKKFHDGIIYAGITPRFPKFAALSERWGEMNDNEFLAPWEHGERIRLEEAFNTAAEKYKDEPEKMRFCIERAFEAVINNTLGEGIDRVTDEILKDID